MKERLQKLLAQANIASRRASEDLISAGRVRVNDTVAHLGDKADPITDVIEVDGTRLKFDTEKRIYIAFNKPKQVLSTDKPHRTDKRQTVADMLGRKEHLFSIGRLDVDSEGLVVMTNDGDLAQRLSHPRYRHSKTYRVDVLGLPSAETLETWQRGVVLEDGWTAPCFVEIVQGSNKISTLRVVMTEGKKRQIRRIAALLRHPVRRLVRTHIGLYALGDLEPGQSRELTAKDVMVLSTPAPEIKTLHSQRRRSAAEKEALPGTEVQEQRRTRRIQPAPADDETTSKRRPSRKGVEVSAYADSATRRTPRTRPTEEEEPEQRRSSRSKPFASSDEEKPAKRRTPRTKPRVSAARNVGKRRISRAATSDSAEEAPAEAPKKRSIPRMRRPASMGKPTPRVRLSEEEAPERRTARVTPAAADDEKPNNRRTARAKTPDAAEEAPKKRTIRRPRKNDAHDDRWGKPSTPRKGKPGAKDRKPSGSKTGKPNASRDRKPGRRKDQPR